MKTKTFPFWPLIRAVLLAVIVSFYLFPIGFHGLPESLNTKQMLAAFGAVLFVLRSAAKAGMGFNLKYFISFIYAVAFSIWCYFSCTFNNTSDYAYATYFLSFFVWISGAYAVISFLRAAYGRVTLSILTQFIAIVCIAQGVIAVLVDNIPSLASFVDTWIIQDTVPKQVKRLYGIGCSLDSGGVRMCMAEVLIAHQLVTDRSLAHNRKMIVLYASAFIAIVILGNMIARTTTVGLILAIVYYIFYVNRIRRGRISRRQMSVKRLVFLIVVVAFIGATYLYNTNDDFHHNIRFAFEGFFNLLETGEFRTSSTDTLNERMWVWPWNLHGWVYGYGLFEWKYWYDLDMQTDIGYCRFTLYCGLVGLVLFSLYFIYNASIVARKFKDARVFSLVLLALTFVIWIKVSTDIFQLYALLFCLPDDYGDEEKMLET